MLSAPTGYWLERLNTRQRYLSRTCTHKDKSCTDLMAILTGYSGLEIATYRASFAPSPSTCARMTFVIIVIARQRSILCLHHTFCDVRRVRDGVTELCFFFQLDRHFLRSYHGPSVVIYGIFFCCAFYQRFDCSPRCACACCS